MASEMIRCHSMSLVHAFVTSCIDYCNAIYAGRRRRLLTSCNECSMLPPVWSVTHGSLIVAWRHSSTMSFIGWMCQRGSLTRWVHDVPLSSWSGTSVPRRPFYRVLWRRFSASSAFCKPSPAHCNSLSSQHIWPSGVFDQRSHGLEFAVWRAQRSGMWFWQF